METILYIYLGIGMLVCAMLWWKWCDYFPGSTRHKILALFAIPLWVFMVDFLFEDL